MKFRVLISDHKFQNKLDKINEGLDGYKVSICKRYGATNWMSAVMNNSLWDRSRTAPYYNLKGETIRVIKEGLHDEQWFSEHKGGMIIFSTTFNIDSDEGNLFTKFLKWFQMKYISLVQMMAKDKKTKKILSANEDVVGWTLGNFYKGRYKDFSSDRIFDENSTTVEILGISSGNLIDISTQICKEFNQQTVLLKDYNSGKILVINQEENYPEFEDIK